MKRGPIGLTLSALLIYLFLSLNQLSVFPSVGGDEPWIAAASYKLAIDGVYGSDLFKGHYGMERHVYEQMPVYSWLQAGVFKLFGVGVVQMRLLSVAGSTILRLRVLQDVGPARAVAPRVLARSSIDSLPTGLLNVMDLETAIEIYTPLYRLFLTASLF